MQRFHALLMVVLGGAACGPITGQPRDRSSVQAVAPSAQAFDRAVGPFLDERDLAPGARVRPLSAASLRGYMAQAADLYRPSPLGVMALPKDGESTGLGISGACVDQAFGELTIRARGEQAEVSGDLVLDSCLARVLPLPAEATVVKAEQRVRVHLALTCEGFDLSSWDGKPLKELGRVGDFPCASATVARIRGQVEDEQLVILRTRQDGVVREIEQGRRLIRAQQGPKGEACRFAFKDGLLHNEACVEVQREILTRSRVRSGETQAVDPAEGLEDYLRIERQGAKAPLASPWYRAGKARLVRNDWRGTVLFQEQGAPLWRMRNGAQRREAGIVAEGGEESRLVPLLSPPERRSH